MLGLSYQFLTLQDYSLSIKSNLESEENPLAESQYVNFKHNDFKVFLIRSFRNVRIVP